MFDEKTNIMLFCLFVGACLATLSFETYGPRAELTTAVDTSRLPSLPLQASPDGSPAQPQVREMRVALGEGFEAQLLYGYVLEGRVVTRRQFRHDPTSSISPLDMGIVWGDLAQPGGVDDIVFRAEHRAVRATPSAGAHLHDDWFAQVTNNHLIPANQSVNDALMAIEVGASVRLRGYLVLVTGAQIRPWRSSTKRGDSTFNGGCEIILVTGVEVLSTEGPSA